MPATRSRTIALSAEPRLVYVDSSALVKLVIREAETDALVRHLGGDAVWVTSAIASVEVGRAAAVANPGPETAGLVDRLIDSCLVVACSAALLRAARRLASERLRTLDAIHLASALRVEADELVAYDRRLLRAAAAHALDAVSPR